MRRSRCCNRVVSALIIHWHQQVVAMNQRYLRRWLELLLVIVMLVGDALMEDDQTTSIETNNLVVPMVVALA